MRTVAVSSSSKSEKRECDDERRGVYDDAVEEEAERHEGRSQRENREREKEREQQQQYTKTPKCPNPASRNGGGLED